MGVWWKRGVTAPPYFVYGIMPENEPLRQQLLQCQVELLASDPIGWRSKSPEHRTGGNCGELVNMQVNLSLPESLPIRPT
jgi:hypothetical protein